MAAAVASSGLSGHRNDVFTSVFPPTNFTTPTPETTPNIGVLASPGKSFGGFNISSDAIDNTIRLSRAWSTVTRYLQISDGQSASLQAVPDVPAAIAVLLESADIRRELLAWYVNEVQVHFRHFVLPGLSEWQDPVPIAKALPLLNSTVALLQNAASCYAGQLESLVESAPPESFYQNRLRALIEDVKHRLQVLVLNSLPRQRLQKTLASVFYQQMKVTLQNCGDPPECISGGDCKCPLNLDGTPLAQLDVVGLGGALAERAFAQAVNRFLEGPATDRRCFQVDWNFKHNVMPAVRFWMEFCFLPFVERSLATLKGAQNITLSEAEHLEFARIAVTHLGRKRTMAFFDYVKAWPESMGGILDIREYMLLNPSAESARALARFTDQLHQRLLHAGASTSEILSIYTYVIHALRLLDARGVFLEKVAVPLRNYLRSRDDTVSIIAASFLADVDEDGNVVDGDSDKVCADITIEVNSSGAADAKEHKTLNWNDMEWVPDPIDAGPDFKASTSEDVVAYILGLFDQEDFIKEVTVVLAQHLLQASDSEYVKETRLVELFKSRLDSTKLQAAEVMLKDMRDSVSLNKRINPNAGFSVGKAPTPQEIKAAIPEEGITLSGLYRMFEGRMKQAQFHAALTTVANKRKDLYFPKRTRLPPGSRGSADNHDDVDFKVDVLSSFFWPQMRTNDFDMPPELQNKETPFNTEFERLGSQRRLYYRHALSRVSVELQLEDRSVRETNLPAWRASVIHTFGSEAELTVERLMDVLKMEEELVQDALSFWTGKRVLYQTAQGTYAVLERLDMDTGPALQQTQQHGESVSAVMSQDAMLRENAPMFETFIANMLRNSGPKEIGGMMGITGMLKMVLPTFTYGEEEVKWLLEQMEGRGEVAKNGDVWAVSS